MLEERLEPIRAQLRQEGNARAKFKILRRWFRAHQENLAKSTQELALLCSMPDSERRMLTYPVVGNWFLERLDEFDPSSSHQAQIHKIYRTLVLEKRFHNPHLEKHCERSSGFGSRQDLLTTTMLSSPGEAVPLHDFVESVQKEAISVINALPPPDGLTSDYGHGIISPIHAYVSLTGFFEAGLHKCEGKPSNLSAMVIDDECPQRWYERLLEAGFRHVSGQQGYFRDCESALGALKTRRYDVILSDIELGKGKMDGIAFAQEAYHVQRARGIVPIISLFSYSNARLREADCKLYRSAPQILFRPATGNNKARWTAWLLRMTAENEIRLSRP